MQKKLIKQAIGQLNSENILVKSKFEFLKI